MFVSCSLARSQPEYHGVDVRLVLAAPFCAGFSQVPRPTAWDVGPQSSPSGAGPRWRHPNHAESIRALRCRGCSEHLPQNIASKSWLRRRAERRGGRRRRQVRATFVPSAADDYAAPSRGADDGRIGKGEEDAQPAETRRLHIHRGALLTLASVRARRGVHRPRVSVEENSAARIQGQGSHPRTLRPICRRRWSAQHTLENHDAVRALRQPC